MKTLLVVDDHPIVLEGIQSVLTDRGFKIIKAATADLAMMAVEHIGGIDIVVCDLQIGGDIDGLSLIEKMREKGYGGSAIVYTMHDELWNMPRLLNADLDGVVLKGDSIMELVNAIEAVASGNRYYSPAFTKRRTETLHIGGILSSRTIEVLQRIAHGESTREIADSMCLSDKAIEYHRGAILKKLNSKNMTEAIRRAIDLGIIDSH